MTDKKRIYALSRFINNILTSNKNNIGNANKIWDTTSGGVNIAANTNTPIMTYLRLFITDSLDNSPILFKQTKIKGN